MNTKILEYIVAVAEEKSVSKAADRFFISRPVLSNHIRSLEKELGAPLFQRDHQGMQLTPAGVIFVNDAQAILHIQHDLEQRLSAMTRRSDNRIRVAIDTSYYNSALHTILPEFHKLHPECAVELTRCNAGHARSMLLAGEADLGVFPSLTPYVNGLESINHNTISCYLVFPPGYSGPTDIAHLPEVFAGGLFPFLHQSGTTLRSCEEQRLADYRIYPENCYEGQYRDALSYLLGGNACAILPDQIYTVFESKKLVKGEFFMRTYDMITYSQGQSITPECQDFMETVIKEQSKGVAFKYFSSLKL